MNNRVKKTIASLLVVSTAFSGALATASLAAPDSNIITSVNAKEQGHITIRANVGDNGEVQSLAGKKFNVYKIFDAENSAGMESINYTMNPAYEKA
ncbi:cell wall anchor protein, partial [Erysipelatoclostridium ramosum]|nr:cell wall anchor protein [Thomasclavelia ramosa]